LQQGLTPHSAADYCKSSGCILCTYTDKFYLSGVG
jgi:hypothetical protein